MDGSSTSEHQLDAATRLVRIDENTVSGATSDAYWNLNGPFGGVVAAILLRSILEHPGKLWDPVALTVNFCAPLKPGVFRIRVREIRTNRSTQHWSLELTQDEQRCVATATAVFAQRPQTWRHLGASPPSAPPPESIARLKTSQLNWLEQYEFRFVRGAPQLQARPAEHSLETLSHFWVNDAPPRNVDFVSLAAFCDTAFARILHARGALVPLGTVSLTAYFHCSSADLASLGFSPLLGVADTRIFHNGFHDQSSELWSRDGQLLATAHQMTYFRDPRVN